MSPSSPPRKLRIDLVSDVVCPWCIVGYRQLERALEDLQGEIESELHWHPFELESENAPGGSEPAGPYSGEVWKLGRRQRNGQDPSDRAGR
ncbi:MAG: DsbA family protein [Myxococcota bacterium]